MNPTAIVCAYSLIGTKALDAVIQSGIKVQKLYTYPQAADEQWFVPPETLARSHSIPVVHATNFNSDENYASIRDQRPDYLFSFYFRDMIQGRFLDLPRLGAFNLHGSLLPKYRGRAPINWAIAEGEKETGLTLHAMTAKPDDGDIFAQYPQTIAWDDTALTVTQNLADAIPIFLPRVLQQLQEGTLVPQAQAALGSSTYFGRRGPEHSRVHFHDPLARVFNEIRAVASPWPNAFIETTVGKLFLSWGTPSLLPCPSGHFQSTPHGILLGFSDGALMLHDLRLKDGPMSRDPKDHLQWLKSLGIPEHKVR